MDYAKDIEILEKSIDRDLEGNYLMEHLPFIASKITVLKYLKKKTAYAKEMQGTWEKQDAAEKPTTTEDPAKTKTGVY